MYNVYPQRSLPTTLPSPSQRKCNFIVQSNFSGFNVCPIYRPSLDHKRDGSVCSFFHFVPTSVFMVGERSESVKRWDYFFDGDDSLWTLLSRLHCRVLESRFFYRSHPPFLPVIFDLFLFYNELM